MHNSMYLVLFIVGVLLLHNLSQGFEPLKDSYIHTNWGIIFTYVSRVLNGVSKYKHTFGIAIPNCTYTPVKMLNCSVHHKIEDNCIAINNMLSTINTNYAAEFHDLAEKVDITLSAMGTYRIHDDASDAASGSHNSGNFYQSHGRRKRDSFLPANFCDDPDNEKYRSSTASNVVSSFFGTVNRDDIIVMMRHLCELADVTKLDTNEIQKSNEYLSSVSNTLNDRISNLESGLSDINSQIAQEQMAMYTFTSRLAAVVGNTSLETELILESQERLYIIFGQLHFFETKLNSIINGIETWTTGAHTLMSGYLSPSMVTVVDLNNLLDYIRQVVLQEPTYQNRLYMVHRNPAFFYEYRDIAYTRDNKYIYITVNVPLTANAGLLSTYRVDKLHVGISEGKNWSTRIENIPNYFSISSDRQFYAELSSVHYSSCKGEDIKVCPFEETLKRTAIPTCVSSLFQNDALNVKKLCHFAFDDRPVDTQTVMLDDNRYWIHSKYAGDNVRWNKFCIKNNQGVTQTISSCKNCVLTIPCFCGLSSVDFSIPINLHNCDITSATDQNTKIVLEYPINLAFASHYHPVENFLQITSNQTSPHPLDIGNVVFNITRSNWSNVVQIDKQFDIDFNRLVEQEKLHQVAYADTSAHMLEKALNLRDVFSGQFNDIKSKIHSGMFAFLNNPHYVIFHLSLTVFLSLSAIGMDVGTCLMRNSKIT